MREEKRKRRRRKKMARGKKKRKKRTSERKKKRGVCEVENQSDDNSPPWTEGLSERSNNVETKKNINLKHQ